jgi:ABC-type uncharacterized transport system permease subunit
MDVPTLSLCVLCAYALASALHLAYLVVARAGLARLARLSLGLAFFTHTAEMSLAGMRGVHPASSVPEALAFAAWLLVLVYLLLSFRYRTGIVGGFVAPVALVLELLARAGPQTTLAAGAGGVGALGRVHITLSMAGVALFALAAAVAALYLLSEAQLKAKRIGVLQHRGPPLATLDALGHRCITIGFPVFTLALITGALWVARRHAQYGLRPEYSISIATWLAFAALLVARTTAGWQGRRAAWLTLGGFGGTLLVVLLYLFRHLTGA